MVIQIIKINRARNLIITIPSKRQSKPRDLKFGTDISNVMEVCNEKGFCQTTPQSYRGFLNWQRLPLYAEMLKDIQTLTRIEPPKPYPKLQKTVLN